MDVFERLESNVRSYSRTWPVVFDRAQGPFLFDAPGRCWLDFFSGAGALNYGHNDPRMARRLIGYILAGGVAHALDMATTAKRAFLERFERVILQPRGLTYRVQFTGPTGTNCVEAALKLARKVTGRTHVLHFRSSFHGVSLGSLAVCGDGALRRSAGVPLGHALTAPFPGDLGPEADTIEHLEVVLAEREPRELPAAVIVETIQAEGGLRVSSYAWQQRLAALCRRLGMLLIVDDIQVGCGRTGTFFSFEPADIQPDLVCLSKSLSGFGLPLSVLLVKPEHDRWAPGEHNGTFRGNNLAFVTAHEALAHWEDDRLARDVRAKGVRLRESLDRLAVELPVLRMEPRGRGMIQGLAFAEAAHARRASQIAFTGGLLVEVCGPDDGVLKLLPPLTISEADLADGLGRLEQALRLLATFVERSRAFPVDAGRATVDTELSP